MRLRQIEFKTSINLIGVALLFLIPPKSYSQFKLVIDNIIISSISGESKYGTTDFYEGPFFHFDCKLIYNGDDTIINLKNFNYYYFDVNYRFKGKSYTCKPSNWDFESSKVIELANNDTIALSFDGSFLQKSGVFKGDGDYTTELIEILPTLSVCLKCFDFVELCTCEINNVEIK